MFDMFFKPKFFTKCKYCVKILKMRLDATRRKKNAILKFLKNDIAELLRSGLDRNAYNRAEGLLVERNVLKCYDLIDEFSGTIYSQLSVMSKQRECPDECREAVASLIYAAARFADLPELRELRSLFTEKYGSSFEPFTNKELIEKPNTMALTKEAKLQLLQEIAQESGIEWNSKALEQQLYTPPQNQPDGDRSARRRNEAKVAFVPVIQRKTSSLRRKDNSDDDSIFDSRSENGTETSTGDSSTDQDVHKGVSEDEVEDQKRFIPPPYLKSKRTKKEASSEEPTRKVTNHVDNDESNKQHPKPALEEKSKPRSVRRRNIKLEPIRDVNIDNSANDGTEEASSSRNKGKETMIEEEKGAGDEEKMLDELLIHYSKKKSTQESNRAKGNFKSHKYKEKDTKNSKDEDFSIPTRSVSLPRDTNEPTKPVKIRHTRNNSYVHPKLPDYDQLAARFAALKEK